MTSWFFVVDKVEGQLQTKYEDRQQIGNLKENIKQQLNLRWNT